MRRLFAAALFVALAAPFAHAQSDDYNKYDFYAGFSHNRIDTGGVREGLNGFEAAATRNLGRYVGVKGDYAFHRKRFDFGFAVDCVNIACPAPFTATQTFDLHTLVGGVEFKDNGREARFKPFAHVLAGFSNARFHLDNVAGAIVAADSSDTSFSAAVGGGLDFRVGRRFDVRAIQLDYNPTRFGGATQHNFRIGAGIVFR